MITVKDESLYRFSHSQFRARATTTINALHKSDKGRVGSFVRWQRWYSAISGTGRTLSWRTGTGLPARVTDNATGQPGARRRSHSTESCYQTKTDSSLGCRNATSEVLNPISDVLCFWYLRVIYFYLLTYRL